MTLFSGIARIKAALSGAAFLFLVVACSTLDYRQEAAIWAKAHGLAQHEIVAGSFLLTSYVRRPVKPEKNLVIYIEGDGAPWPSPYHAPSDPTPHQPVSLYLAAAASAPAVAYLGRPCQYLETKLLEQCSAAYWTERRFAPEVIDAFDVAVSRLKSDFGAASLRLVGYSGGGVIATLLAARRKDVASLVTVVAPLAVSKWTRWHGVSALTGSLDPAMVQDAHLPASVHFLGENDKTVPPAIVQNYIAKIGGRMEIVSGFDHECCWARDWTMLLGRLPVQENAK